jgi:hypothetical protein
MKHMHNAILEIMQSVFPGEEYMQYSPRFELLYQAVFELAPEAEWEPIKTEVICCEQRYAENTRICVI